MTSRRSFFQTLGPKIFRLGRETFGHRYVAFHELRRWPGSILRRVEPVRRPEPFWKITRHSIQRVEDGVASFRRDLDDLEWFSLHHFDRQLDLGSISAVSSETFGCDEAEAWAKVSRLFLDLTEAGFCHPATIPAELEEL